MPIQKSNHQCTCTKAESWKSDMHCWWLIEEKAQNKVSNLRINKTGFNLNTVWFSVWRSKQRNERLVIWKQRNELTSFCQLKVLKLESRGTGTPHKREVDLGIPWLCFSCHTIWRNADIFSRERAKPDIRGHSVLRLLVFHEIGTKAS